MTVLLPVLLTLAAAVSNEHAIASQRSLAAGEQLVSRRPMLVVMQTGTPGTVQFRKPGEAFRNQSNTTLQLVEIEFPGLGLDQEWGATGLAPNYKVLLENRYTRVYDIRIPAGSSEPQHTHHARIVVCLSGAQLRHVFPGGKTEDSTLTTGEIAWRGASTHIGQNLGKTDSWVIAVEPK